MRPNINNALLCKFGGLEKILIAYGKMLKGVILIKDAFAGSIRYRVGSNNRVLFWHDTWAGNRPLVVQFLDLSRCARDTNAKVGDISFGQILWAPSLDEI